MQEIDEIKKLYLQTIEYSTLLPQLISLHKLMLLLQKKNLQISFRNYIQTHYLSTVEKIDKALRDAFLREKEANEICLLPESQYMNQMKEVLAFMGVEDYHTYRVALEIDEQIKSLNSNQSVTTLTKFIDDAVEKLVPPSPSQLEKMSKE